MIEWRVVGIRFQATRVRLAFCADVPPYRVDFSDHLLQFVERAEAQADVSIVPHQAPVFGRCIEPTDCRANLGTVIVCRPDALVPLWNSETPLL